MIRQKGFKYTVVWVFLLFFTVLTYAKDNISSELSSSEKALKDVELSIARNDEALKLIEEQIVAQKKRTSRFTTAKSKLSASYNQSASIFG